MVFEINGVDFIGFIAKGGFSWQRNDMDSPDSGRSLDALLHRKRVSTKIRLDITCRPLKTYEASKLLTAIMPEFVTVRYTDPQAGSVLTKTMYSNNNPASVAIIKNSGKPDEEVWWGGITFPLIEQ